MIEFGKCWLVVEGALLERSGSLDAKTAGAVSADGRFSKRLRRQAVLLAVSQPRLLAAVWKKNLAKGSFLNLVS